MTSVLEVQESELPWSDPQFLHGSCVEVRMFQLEMLIGFLSMLCWKKLICSASEEMLVLMCWSFWRQRASKATWPVRGHWKVCSPWQKGSSRIGYEVLEGKPYTGREIRLWHKFKDDLSEMERPLPNRYRLLGQTVVLQNPPRKPAT